MSKSKYLICIIILKNINTLLQIVSAGKLTLPLLGVPGNKGILIVVAEELEVCRDEVMLQFSGRHLDRKDWFGK